MLPPPPKKTEGSLLPPPPKKKDGTELSSINLEGGSPVGGSAPLSTEFKWSPNKTTNDIVQTEVSVGPTPEPDKTLIPAYQEQEKQKKKEEYFTGLASRYLESIPGLTEYTPSQLEALKKKAATMGIEPSYIDEAITGVKSLQNLKKGQELVNNKRSTVEQNLTLGTGDYDIMADPGSPLVKTDGTAPIEVTPEIVNNKLQKDAKYFAKQQFPQYDRLFRISDDIKLLQGKEILTEEEQGRLKNLLDNYYSIADTEMLFDPKTGQFVDQPNEDTKQYQAEVDFLKKRYEQTPMDKMGELFLQKKELLSYYEQQYFAEGDKGFDKSELDNLGMSPDAFAYEVAVNGLKPDTDGKYRLSPDQARNLGINAEDLNVYRQNYIDARKDFDAVTQAFVLNLDPGKGDTGWFSNLESGIREGLANSTIVGPIAEMFNFDASKMTDVQRLETYAKNASEAGVNLTPTQQKELESDLGETVMRAVGNSIPVMGDIAAVAALRRGLGSVTGVASSFKSMVDAATGKYGKIVGGAIDIIGTGLVTAAEFDAAGAGGATGAGEGLAQGIIDKIGVLDKITGKYAVLIKALLKTGAGGVGETFGEYAGEFANALNNNGFDWDGVIDDTFGKDLDEATKKGLVTLLTSLLFSGTSNSVDVLVSGKEWLSDKDIPNKDELLAGIDKKIAEGEATPPADIPADVPPVDAPVAGVGTVPTPTEEIQSRVATITTQEDAKKLAEDVMFSDLPKEEKQALLNEILTKQEEILQSQPVAEDGAVDIPAPVVVETAPVEDTPIKDNRVATIEPTQEPVNENKYSKLSDQEIENRMGELENSNNPSDRQEFSVLEKEMEQREWYSVMNKPLSEADAAIDLLLQKEKDMPNGFGAFIEKRDASEAKGVIKKYSSPDKISNKEVLFDIYESMMANPTTWYADAIKLRESILLAIERGATIEEIKNRLVTGLSNEGNMTIGMANAIVEARIGPVLSALKNENTATTKAASIETTPVVEPAPVVEPTPTKEPIPIGQKLEYRDTENGPRLMNRETGKPADLGSVRKYENEVIDKLGETWDQEERVEEQPLNGTAYVSDVLDNSENPFQIAGAFLQSEELPFSLDYQSEAIADALESTVIDRQSFIDAGDVNLLPDVAGYSFGDNLGTVNQLDIIADEITELSGIETSTDDIIEFMRNNPSIKEFRAQSKNPFSRKIQQKFKALTGIALNKDTVIKMQEKEFKLLEANEAEIEALYNQSEATNYEQQQQEYEAYLDNNPDAAAKAYGETEPNKVEGQPNQDNAGTKSTGTEEVSYTEQTKKLADNIRKLKISTKGTAGINIAPAVWNAAVDIVASTVENGGKIADAIAKGVKYIKDTQAYKNATAADKKALEAQFKEAFGVFEDVKIPKNTKKTIEETTGVKKEKTKVVVDEMSELKRQIRAEARAAAQGFRQGVSDTKKAGKEFAAKIAEAIKPLGSRLNPSQIKALVGRAAKVSTERQLEKFQEYAEKVISDANYADNLAAIAKAIKQLKRKPKGRFQGKIREIGKLNLNELTTDEVTELKQVLDLANQKVPDTSLLQSYIVPEQSKRVKTPKTIEDYLDAKKKLDAKEINDFSDVRSAARAINDLRRALNLMYQTGTIEEDVYVSELAQLDADQDSIGARFEDDVKILKEQAVQNIKNNLSSWDKEDFTEQENNLIQNIKNLTPAEIMALNPGDVEILSDVSDRISEGMLPVFEANNVYNRAIGKSNGKKIASQINEAVDKYGLPVLEKAQKKLRRIESQKVEDVLNVGRGDAIYKYLYNALARGITRMRKSNDELSKKYSEAVVGSIKEKLTPLAKKKEILSTSKVGILRRLLSTRNTEGTSGGWVISSFDYFGLLLGEEQAYNNLIPAEGNTDIEGAKKKLRDHMTEQAELYSLVPNGKIDGKNQLDIMREVYQSLPRNQDGSVDIDNVILTAREERIAKAIDEILEEQRRKQMFANESKGLPFEEQAFYLPTIGIGKPPKDLDVSESALNPKLRAGASYEKRDYYPKAISINLGEMIGKSIKETNKDYYVNEVLGQVNPTLAYSDAGLNMPSNVVKKIIKDDIAARIKFNMESAGLPRVLSNLMSVGYVRSLANPISRVSDTAMSFIKVPTYMGTAKGIGVTFSPEQREIFNKLIEDTDSSLGLKTSRRVDPNVMGEREDQNIYKRAVDKVMSVDEALNMAGAWMPTFESSFLDNTGMDFNREAYLNDPSYYTDNKRAIDDAAGLADRETKKLYGPGTKLEQRQNVQLPFFDIKANTFWGIMAGYMNMFSNRGQGEMFDNLWQIYSATNKNRDVAARQALSLFLTDTGYGWMAAMGYALIEIYGGGDDEDKKKAQKAISNLTSIEGVLGEMGATLAYLGMSKYAAAGKYFTLVSLSTVHELTTDKELKGQIKDFTKANLFTYPIKFTPEGGAMSLMQMTPPIAMAYTDVMKVIKGGTGWKDSPDGIKSLWEKVNKKGFEGLTKTEQDRWALFALSYNSLSLVSSYWGYSVPMKSRIDKVIRTQVKEASKKK